MQSNPAAQDHNANAEDLAHVTSVRVQLNEEELARALHWQAWSAPGARAAKAKTLAVVAVLGGGLPLLLTPLLFGSNPTSFTTYLAEFVATSLVLTAAVAWSMWRQPSATARVLKRDAPKLFEPEWWTLQDGGILVQLEGQSGLKEWRSIREIYQTHELLIFHAGGPLSSAIPRRCFPSPAASQKFAELARELWQAARVRTTDPPSDADLDAALGADRVALQYRLEKRDLSWFVREASRTYLRRHPLRLARFLFVCLLISAGVGLIAFVRGAPIGIGAGVVALGASPVLLFAVQLRQQYRTLVRAPGVLCEHRIWASERGLIRFTQDNGIGRSDWTAYSVLRRQGDYLLFEQGGLLQAVVPMRGQDPQTCDRILGWHAAAVTPTPAPEVHA